MPSGELEFRFHFEGVQVRYHFEGGEGAVQVESHGQVEIENQTLMSMEEKRGETQATK